MREHRKKKIERKFQTYDLRNQNLDEYTVAPEVKPLEIKIKYHADIDKIKKIEVGDWIDLRAAEDVTLKKNEFKIISLGVSMELPAGYEAIVAPRSSTYKKYGIIVSNSIGVIDSSYCGNDDVWGFPAIALKNTMIHKNDRICQFRIQKIQPKVEFVEVDDLGNENRQGFGSTGVQ